MCAIFNNNIRFGKKWMTSYLGMKARYCASHWNISPLMNYKRILFGVVFLVLLMHTVMVRRLMQRQSNKFGLKIDQSKIQSYTWKDAENDGIVINVPLVDSVNTSSEEIKQGDVYISFQCMATGKLNHCFNVRLTNVNEKEANLTLVDDQGKIITTSTTNPVDRNF